jgi:hypothetical protein
VPLSGYAGAALTALGVAGLLALGWRERRAA